MNKTPQTIPQILNEHAVAYADSTAFSHKKEGAWHSITYQSFKQQSDAVSALLIERKIKTGDRVGLLLENGPMWPVFYMGIVSAGAVAVPIDAKLKEQEVAHILRDSEANALFIHAKSYNVIRQIDASFKKLDAVFVLDGVDVVPISDKKSRYLNFETAVKHTAPSVQLPDVKPETPASIIYTSGTTGRQKGAVLTHKNFTTNIYSCLQSIQVKTSDHFMLVLPLHHAFAFTANFLVPLAAGAPFSFVESLRTISENMGEVQPTVLIGVPLLLEKMNARIQAGLRQKKAASLLWKLGAKRLIGKQILSKLGGKLRLIVTGGAPCDPELIQTWSKMGICVLEGYGLTESAPVLSLNPPDAPRPGTVGKPLPCVTIQIDSANEHTEGEILAKGDNIMQGYHRDAQATKSVIQNGWLHTGDLGYFDSDGYLIISGRKKNLIVNREGKNIHPEEVEHHILKSPYILEAVVLGFRAADETTGERVGVIVVPNQEEIDKRNMSDDEITQLLQNEVRKQCAHLADYKHPRKIQIQYEEFEKTSTAKIKRYLYAIRTT